MRLNQRLLIVTSASHLSIDHLPQLVMIFRLLKKDTHKDAARRLYFDIADASRRPEFFRDANVPDTVEGRYDVLCVHMFLVLRRLKKDNAAAQTKAFSQHLFDVFFKSMDGALRELGVGDLSVGKRIRNMAEAFYGRAGAYEEAMDAQDQAKLVEAVSRNLYATDELVPGAQDIAAYMLKTEAELVTTDVDALLNGELTFPPFVASNHLKDQDL